MDIRGLVLINSTVEAVNDPMRLSSLPYALLETVGKTPLQRMEERLRRFGIESVPVSVAPGSGRSPSFLAGGQGASAADVEHPPAPRERFWRTAEAIFNDMAQDGAELVVLVNLGAYAEVDFEKLVQFHLDSQARVTQVRSGPQPLEIFCLSSSHRDDAASLFRSQLAQSGRECMYFEHQGYTNELRGPRDLRQFAIDILRLRTETLPAGMELRPGVWAGTGAAIEKGARVLAPAFIGDFAQVRAGAVVTRCSTVEHHACVDCGTVVENSTILPYSVVGAGLDLAHSAVGSGRIANLRRDVSVEIADPKLVNYVVAPPMWGLLHAARDLAAYLPRRIWKGLWGETQTRQPDLQAVLHQTSPALGTAAGYQAPACPTEAADKFPSGLTVARRYGNQ